MKFIFLIIICFFYGCTGLATQNHIVGKYYLIAVDVDEQLDLSYHDQPEDATYATIVESTVFAVGFNEKYIIVKQHPNNFRNITKYFIVPIKNEGLNVNAGVIGPLTLDEFESQKKLLKLEDVKFTIVYKNLE